MSLRLLSGLPQGCPDQGVRCPARAPSSALQCPVTVYLPAAWASRLTHHPPPAPRLPHTACSLNGGGKEGTVLSLEHSGSAQRATGEAEGQILQTRKVGRGRRFSGLEKPPSPHRGGGWRKTGAQTPLAQTRPASLKAGKPRSFKTFMPFDPEMLLLRICPKKIIKNLHKNIFLVVIYNCKKKKKGKND